MPRKSKPVIHKIVVTKPRQLPERKATNCCHLKMNSTCIPWNNHPCPLPYQTAQLSGTEATPLFLFWCEFGWNCVMGEELLWAVKNGDLDQVKGLSPKVWFRRPTRIPSVCNSNICHAWQVDLNKELINGRMAIHFAADYGQKDVIDYLVSQKADVNVSGSGCGRISR